MTDDQESLRKIRLGGKPRVEGVSELYRAYAGRFVGYFVRHRVPQEQAEDLAQDVFVSIVKHVERFRGDTRVDAWMWAIARNCLMDHFRRVRPEVALDEDDLLKLADAQEFQQEDKSEGLDDCVRQAFSAFAEAYRDRAEILKLVVFEEWSMTEVAAVLKRSPGATREYVSQCRKKLRSFLDPCRQFLAV